MSAIVSDSSPLIYLALLSDFDLLRKIFGTLLIPPAVYREVVIEGSGYPAATAVKSALNKWIYLAETPSTAATELIRGMYDLDAGETEAIAISETLGETTLLMDEARGVACARSRGLMVVRTPMIYAQAKGLGLIPTIRPKLDALRANGFRLSDAHYERVLRELEGQ